MRKVLASILILILTLSACGNRSTTVPSEDRVAGPDTGKLEPSTEQETTHPENHLPELKSQPPQPPIPMTPVQPATPATRTPAARSPAARPSVVQPSRSLAGHDRFLVSRPLDGVGPADFELGLLFDRHENPSFEPLLTDLATALMKNTLKTAAFNDQALMLAELLYSPDLASNPEVVRIRFSEVTRRPGASYTLEIRLFSELGSAKGLAILGSDEDDTWVIEHLDLDLRGLGEEKERSTLWDPYGYSRNLFD